MMSVCFPAFKKTLPSMSNKTVVITGTTTGTGFVAAKTLGELGANVVMLNRKSERSDRALTNLQSEVPDGKFNQVECDLMSLASVRNAANEVLKQFPEVDVLCNNAGIMAFEDNATKDGFDVQMQTNHISHFLLTAMLYPALEKAAEKNGEARIVNHTSVARYGGPLEEKYFEKNGGNLGGNGSWFQNAFFTGPRWTRYHQSKLANITFTNALHEKLSKKNSKVKAYAAHPGYAITELQIRARDSGADSGNWLGGLLKRYAQSAEDGTMGILKGMALPDAPSGSFYGPGKGYFAFNGEAELIESQKFESEGIDLLWKKSEEAIGEKFTI